jgi:hypothetical protein
MEQLVGWSRAEPRRKPPSRSAPRRKPPPRVPQATTTHSAAPAQEKEKEKRRPTQKKEKEKRRERELTGIGPRRVRRLKPTLIGEEKEGWHYCCAPST